MWPSRTEWGLLQLVGLLAFVIGLFGYAVVGWRFDGTGDPAPTALAVIAAAVAIVLAFARYR